MSTGSVLFGIALLALVALFLARPFLLAPVREPRRSRRLKLLQQKEALLAQIQALDFDHETEKISTDQYHAQREQLVRETAVLMHEIDALQAQATTATPAVDLDARIEAAVAALRAAPPAPARAPRAARPSGGYCPQCGQPVAGGDNFCTACGHRLVEQQAVSTT